jgi:hypothetical protein
VVSSEHVWCHHPSHSGTMSLNEIAVDLTCESAEFEPASSSADTWESDDDRPVPGQFSFPSKHSRRPSSSSLSPQHYHVHSGMLRMARAMGNVGKPVQIAVQEALHRNPEYGPSTALVISGSKPIVLPQISFYVDTALVPVSLLCSVS